MALTALSARLEPASPLAATQRCWEAVVGEAIAASARPVAERAGVLEIACEDAVGRRIGADGPAAGDRAQHCDRRRRAALATGPRRCRQTQSADPAFWLICRLFRLLGRFVRRVVCAIVLSTNYTRPGPAN